MPPSSKSSCEGAAQELLEKLRFLEKVDPDGKLEITQRMNTIVEKGLKKMVEASGEYLHSDSIDKDDAEKVKNLLDIMPESLAIKNKDGKLPPLQVALKCGAKWTPQLRDVINEQGDELSEIDSDSGMYPFLQASVSNCELSVVFDLIRRYPEALQDCNKSDWNYIHKKNAALSMAKMKSNIAKISKLPPSRPSPKNMSKEDLQKSKKICHYLMNTKYGKNKNPKPLQKKHKRKLNEKKIEWNR
jgi:hypothetical protein